MKYLVFSDLHGSYTLLERLLEEFINKKCDKIICLGDLLYHGPRNDLPSGYAPKKVIEVLKPLMDKFIWVQGNCDAEVDEMVLNIKFKKKHYLTINNRKIVLTHGHHLSRFDIDETLASGTIVLYGHYHVFDISNINNVTYINIGSPSIPKDGIPQYAVIDDNVLTVYNIDNEVIGNYVI